MEFEEWIKKQVENGVFENEEEAYRVLAYIYYIGVGENIVDLLNSEYFPLTLEKAKDIGFDVINEEKLHGIMEEAIGEIKEEVVSKMNRIIEGMENNLKRMAKFAEKLNSALEVLEEDENEDGDR